MASSGVHGANRLASNSLLESIVFAHRAARAAVDAIGEAPPPAGAGVRHAAAAGPPTPRIRELWQEMTETLWSGAGLVRDARGLRSALDAAERATACDAESLAAIRLRAAARTAALACEAALAREESRGSHFRSDFPESSGQWHGDYVMRKERGARLDSHV